MYFQICKLLKTGLKIYVITVGSQFWKKTDLLLSSLKICLLIEKKTATTTKNRYTSVERHLVIFVGKNKNL